MRGRNFSLVDIRLDYDWTKCQKMVQDIIALKNRIPSSPFGNSDHYDFKSMGVLSQHQLSNQWYRLAGSPIARLIPWLPEMLDHMKDLDPDEGCISYLIGDGSGHIDLPNMKTALNYIFANQDPDAYTWIESDDQREIYPSDVGSAWLLNTQLNHGIKNSGERWTLSIHFNTDYDVVRQWFDGHPHLEFGGKH